MHMRKLDRQLTHDRSLCENLTLLGAKFQGTLCKNVSDRRQWRLLRLRYKSDGDRPYAEELRGIRPFKFLPKNESETGVGNFPIPQIFQTTLRATPHYV